MKILDDILDWTNKYESILKPVINAGMGLYENVRKDNYNNDILGYMQNQQNIANQETDAWNQAVRDYSNQYAAYGAASDAARARQAAANAAAARQTEANRMKAAKKGFKALQKGYKESMGMLNPYIEVGKQILPRQQETYNKFLDNLSLLSGYVMAPGAMERLAPTPTDITTLQMANPNYTIKR